MSLMREPNRKPPGRGPAVHNHTDGCDCNAPWIPVRLQTCLEAARAGLLVWMDSEEAAEYLGVSPARFRDAASKGEFDRYKDLGGYRYHRDDLDRWRRWR